MNFIQISIGHLQKQSIREKYCASNGKGVVGGANLLLVIMMCWSYQLDYCDVMVLAMISSDVCTNAYVKVIL